MSEQFITPTDLEAFLHLNEGDLADDDLATLACDAAMDDIRTLTGLQLDAVTDDVVRLDGDGTDALILPEMPIVDPSAVVITVAGVAVATTDYWVDQRKGMIFTTQRGFTPSWVVLTGTRAALPKAVWIPGRRIYEVTYTHGYVAAASEVGSGSGDPQFPVLPATLKRLMVTLAARIYDQGLVRQETAGGYSVTYAAPGAVLTPVELQLVHRYRRGR